MANYRRGADFEREVRKFRDEQGALFTMRSAGSRGKVDVLAIFPDKVELIQAKRDGIFSGEEKRQLVGLATSLTEATGMQHAPMWAHKTTRGGLILETVVVR